MKYYKVLTEYETIGVVSSNDFRRYYERGQFLGPANEETGEVVSCINKLYRDTWMRAIVNSTIQYELANIVEITEEEYESLNVLNENVETIDESQIIMPETVATEDSMTLEYIRKLKLQQMSQECTQAIENGIDDGSKHYSYTITDQLNLLSAQNAIINGADAVIYHADGEEYEYYNAEEIERIISLLTLNRNYHTAYYNSLKAYINDLNDIQTILSIEYGSAIPEEYKSEVLIDLEGG